MTLSYSYKKTIAQGEGRRLWHLYGFLEPQDLILEDLAFARGVLVTEGPLDNMEARLVKRGDTGLIRVKQDIYNVGQKRFAIAHELGHWELHKNESQFFACTSDDMAVSYKTSIQEGEANMFAAGLLMPDELFLSRSQNKEFSFKTISELTEYFITSLTATAIRYVELSNDYCAIVCSEAGKIRWWRGSNDFENRFWLSPRAKLSPSTIANNLFSKNCKSEEPQEVDIEAWSDKGACHDSNTFIEESKYFERRNQVITFLKLP